MPLRFSIEYLPRQYRDFGARRHRIKYRRELVEQRIVDGVHRSMSQGQGGYRTIEYRRQALSCHGRPKTHVVTLMSLPFFRIGESAMPVEREDAWRLL